MPADTPSVLVIHSAAGRSGKTSICRALARDLAFDIYVKLSRHSSHLIQQIMSSGTLSSEKGDSGLLRGLHRSSWLPPLADVIFLDGPCQETDAAVLQAARTWPLGTRFLIEGSCAPVDSLTKYAYVVPCPLPGTAKPDMAAMIRRADLLIVNRFPGCSSATESALTAILHDTNPQAALLSGSTLDQLFMDTIEAAICELLPVVARP